MTKHEHAPEWLAPEIAEGYAALRQLPDGRWLGVYRLLFHWTLHVDIDPTGYRDRYCYTYKHDAILAMQEWDGTGEPQHWHRHPKSGRRRDKAGNEWVAP